MKKKTALLLFLLLSCILLSGLPAQAAKKETVDVISKMTFPFFTGKGTISVTFKYTKNGLLKSKTVAPPAGTDVPQTKTTYSYNKDNLASTSYVYENGKKIVKVTYGYNKNHQLISRKTVSLTDSVKITVKYTYKKGILSSAVSTYTGTKFTPTKTTFTFNKKGELTKTVMKGSDGGSFSNTTSYKYDKNGYMKSSSYSGSDGKGSTSRKLTYKNGRLVKYQDTEIAGDQVFKDNARNITWKSISVPSAAADIVTRQQKETINTILPFSLLLGNDYF